MEEQNKDNPQVEGEKNQKDCGCEDNCCPPKKNNIFTKIIFAVILLAALGIIGVKLFHQPAASAGKEIQCKPGSSACCDTTKPKTCDTAKGSSCCSKSK